MLMTPVLDRQVTPLDAATSLALATVRPDGRPHVVPVWFHWDGETIAVLSKPQAQKVRNLLAEPRAMVSVGQPGSVGTSLLEVTGEVGAGAAADVADRFGSKYQDLLDAFGLTVSQFLQSYPLVIRLRPTRWLSWGGPGWGQAKASTGPAVGRQRGLPPEGLAARR
jgi:PPOX class probable F420-dependent enzyme